MTTFDHIACIDFETYYDKELSLRKMPATEYIRDDRFEAQTCSFNVRPVGEQPDPDKTYSAVGAEIKSALHEIDWSRTAFLAHHTQFDGLVATHHYGVYPARWLDTMSMARAVFGTDVSVSLKAITERLGRPGKPHADALGDVEGVRFADMSEEQLTYLCEYNRDDVNDTAWIYSKLAGFVSDDEQRLIDITIRMYVEPILLIDGDRVERVYNEEVKRKQALYEAAGLTPTVLRSNDAFAEELRKEGVEPPMKFSVRQQKPIYAFSKQDYEFQGLLSHENERVRTLVEARLASRSTLVETRSESIMRRRGRPTPIYLNYYGARTGRWSGGDGVNWQNLPRRGLGSELRKALVAPPGCRLVVSDASQIEARMLAWSSGERDVLRTFATGGDVYSLAAEPVFGHPVNKDEYPDERFVGKVLTLGAGYGAGAFKINYMLKIGAFGPPVNQSLDETKAAVYAWRAARRNTVNYWRANEDAAITAFLNGIEVDDGTVCFEGHNGNGYLHLPNGQYILYPNVFWDTEEQQLVYRAKNSNVKLYGGIITENITQALARIVLGQQMLVMEDTMPDTRIATTTHDEVLLVVHEDKADECLSNVLQIMSTTPEWAEGLPLNAEGQTSLIYEKS